MENVRLCGVSHACLKIALILYLFVSATCANIYALLPNLQKSVFILGWVFYIISFITALITTIHYCCVKYHPSDADFEQVEFNGSLSNN